MNHWIVCSSRADLHREHSRRHVQIVSAGERGNQYEQQRRDRMFRCRASLYRCNRCEQHEHRRPPHRHRSLHRPYQSALLQQPLTGTLDVSNCAEPDGAGIAFGNQFSSVTSRTTTARRYEPEGKPVDYDRSSQAPGPLNHRTEPTS